MNEKELNAFLDLEWNCAAFTPEESSVSAPLSPKQWACIISDTRNFRSFVRLRSSLLLTGLSSLKNSSRLHGGVRAGKISPLPNGNACYDTSRLCSTIARYRITPLYGADYWRVTVISAQILIRTTSHLATGSGSSSTTRGVGFIAPVRNSSLSRCGGASCTVQPSC